MASLFFKKKQETILPKVSNEEEEYILEIRNLNLWTENKEKLILKNINCKIKTNSVIAIIGPSGSGKSSLLRAINKTNFEDNEYIYEGKILYGKANVLSSSYPVEYLRTQIGTVLQRPVMFPMSIRENILFALKAHGISSNEILEEVLRKSLEDAHLWEEVKDRLNVRPEGSLSLGQQQRLCIARAIALQPKVLLMDEPTSALDLKSSNKIEELIVKISSNKLSTIILVSHSLSQVRRISHYTIFIKNGEIIESGTTRDIFTKPKRPETKDFISGVY
ncbi:phosphate ABC transporter ATP-binding protein [Candidatus Mycoplasma haematobovis]|uniref:Phosphate ABC transporter ATP-binding protein n=1 Tax=Candidatus Mycoplasma haematobovis TaxID=432608 RepID=A0A1A9QC59_9MOLU|nr:phosphate ABC transporter ATP-binding protein [Candidatus Mycoplasma haematobovis]OAL10162.1 phosphate ABC transporter ATP-binding protein [Candidatus Mycoplasma haematobovis]